MRISSPDELAALLSERLLTDTEVLASTALSDLASDRVSRLLVRTTLEELLPGAAPELLESVVTVSDAYDWYLVRQGQGDALTQQAPVQLTPLLDSDVPGLFRTAVAPESGYRWRYRGATPNISDFHRHLYEGVLAQYVIEDASHTRHGLVCAYNPVFESGHVYIGYLRSAGTRSQGELLHGMLFFVDFLFRTWPFRKLYAEIPEYNATDLVDFDDPVIRIEGRLAGHYWYADRWWDQLILAIWRDDWYTPVTGFPPSTRLAAHQTTNAGDPARGRR